jgi:hypothetical protein
MFKIIHFVTSCLLPKLPKMQLEQRELSLQDKQTFAGSTMDGNRLTIRSTAAGIFLPSDQARRFVETIATSEKGGE